MLAETEKIIRQIKDHKSRSRPSFYGMNYGLGANHTVIIDEIRSYCLENNYSFSYKKCPRLSETYDLYVTF